MISIQNYFSGYSHTMSSLNTQVSLAKLILICIERISADILQRISQIIGSYQICRTAVALQKMFSFFSYEKHWSPYSQTYLVQFLIVRFCFFQKCPDISCKKVLHSFFPDGIHLPFTVNICGQS